MSMSFSPQVLVPRYEETTQSYTRVMMAPFQRHDNARVAPYKMLVELRGHPFPPLHYSNTTPNRSHLHNVLLNEARKDRRMRMTTPEQSETTT